MSAILLLNGPNLGILGQREPEVYGTDTLADIERAVGEEVAGMGWKVISFQSDSEGDLVRAVHANYGTVGAIVNPGALMVAGWSLRDALANYPRPWIEVHLSNVWAREQWRHESIIAPLASGVVVGLGSLGYRLGARALLATAAGTRPAPAEASATAARAQGVSPPGAVETAVATAAGAPAASTALAASGAAESSASATPAAAWPVSPTPPEPDATAPDATGPTAPDGAQPIAPTLAATA